MIPATNPPVTCPNCSNDDPRMLDRIPQQWPTFYCHVCSIEFPYKVGFPKPKKVEP